MKIAIIGTGYVGLTTGVALAEIGHQVICISRDLEKLAQLKEGIAPIYEPGLEEIIKKNLAAKTLTFSDDLATAVGDSEVIFICVGTPTLANGQSDLSAVETVAKQIAAALTDRYTVVVDKSTVPVKTAEKVRAIIKKNSADQVQFDVVSNPEFLREGTALKDTLEADRIVIGVDSERAKEKMLAVYQPLITKNHIPVKIVSVVSAELIKYGANTFLAAKISFANLMAEVCEKVGADALEVLEAIGLDPRIGAQFLQPGIGFGGSCFPKDIAAFSAALKNFGVDPALVESIKTINNHAQQRFSAKIEQALRGLEGKLIGVLGLAFKPNTDDIRNSPALEIIANLEKAGAKIKVYDPQAMENVKRIMPNLQYCSNPYQAAENVAGLVICTDWDEFKTLDLAKLKQGMKTPVIFDGRNMFSPAALATKGFRYFSIGR